MQPCELYFFMRIRLRGARQTFGILKTVIWNIAQQQESIARGSTFKRLDVSVSPALALRGFFAALVDVDISYVTVPVDESGARGLLDEPSFSFKKRSLVITLHRITVAGSNDTLKDPFCVP
jgi:hypothetical protein